jgi:hypothetical protein
MQRVIQGGDTFATPAAKTVSTTSALAVTGERSITPCSAKPVGARPIEDPIIPTGTVEDIPRKAAATSSSLGLTKMEDM